MVLIMVTAWIPPDKGTEVGKKYLEVMQKIPYESFEKPLVSAGNAVKDGMKVIEIFEVEKGKYEEALNLTVKRESEFFGIEGYRCEIETLLAVEEAMPMLGL
jgi:hypothetical protein